MGELGAGGVVAFSDDGSPVMSPRLMRQALEASGMVDLPIIDHCEDISLTEGGQVNEGLVSAELGLKGMPAAAEEAMVARDLALAKLTGGRLHIAHVSTAGSVELIRQARREGVNVTAEVTPHHLTLTEECVARCGTLAKVNPPLRTARDVKALTRGLREDVIDAVATDHAPHTEVDKARDFTLAAFGISGFETALGCLMGLVHGRQVSLTTLISKLTCGPAHIIGSKYGKLGTLAIGSPADVTLFDPDISWMVDTADFASKGKNTPLAGCILKGKVMATVSRGELVYRDKLITMKEYC
jgi:dihydroorotase